MKQVFIKKLSKRGGFTIIEILIVVIILSIVLTIIIRTTNSYRVKARDLQRIAEVHAIELAVKLYYADYGHYPITQTIASPANYGIATFQPTPATLGAVTWYDTPVLYPSATNIRVALAPYLKKVPVDPLPLLVSALPYFYRSNDGKVYQISTRAVEDMRNIPTKLINMGSVGSNSCSSVSSASPNCANGKYYNNITISNISGGEIY